MRRLLLVSIVLVLAVTGTALAQVQVVSFESPSLERTRSMQVHLPPGYDPVFADPYPVVYFLHGMGGSYNNPAYEFIHDIFDDLILASVIEPMILVKPDGSTHFLSNEGMVDFGGSVWCNSDLYGAFENYLVNDVPGYVETHYNASSDPSQRAIMGHSMGAFGAMNAALRHHDDYRAVAALSGFPDFSRFVNYIPTILAQNGHAPYDYDPQSGAFTQGFFMLAGAFSPNLENPPYYVDFPLDENGNMIPSIFDDLWLPNDCSASAVAVPLDTPLEIYFDCGTADEFLFYSFNVEFAAVLDGLGFDEDDVWNPGDPIDGDYVFWSFSGGHGSHLTEQVPRALRFIDEAFNAEPVAVDPLGSTPGIGTSLAVHPNPFNPLTNISFVLDREEWTRAGVYDLTGRRVTELSDRVFSAGTHTLTWNGRDTRGGAVPSGAYIIRLETGVGVETRKVMLAR